MEPVSLFSCAYEYDDASLQNQSIKELITDLRSAFCKADFDRVEHVLVAKETQLKAEIGKLQEKLEIERLHSMDGEDKLKKCKDQCENKGKKNELNDGEDDTIAELRIKNRKLEDEKQTWKRKFEELNEWVLRMEKSEEMFMNGDTHVGAADSSPPRNDRESGNTCLSIGEGDRRSSGTRSKDVLGASGCHSNMESISKTIDCYAERSQLQQGAWADKVFASSNLGSDEERQRAKGKGVIEPSKENALPYPTCSIIIRDQSEEESQKINVHNSGNTSLSFFEGTRQTPLTQKKDALGGLESDDDECMSGETLNIGKEATSQIVASSNDNENPCLSVMQRKTLIMGGNDVNGKFKRKCVSQSPYGETDDDTSSTSSLESDFDEVQLPSNFLRPTIDKRVKT